MSSISVLVAASSPDLQADGICAAVAERTDMTLVGGRTVRVSEIAGALEWVPRAQRCALVLLGAHAAIKAEEARWLAERPRLVVVCVDALDDVVRIALRDAGLDSLLDAVRELVDRGSRNPRERVSHIDLHGLAAFEQEPRSGRLSEVLPSRPLLAAADAWIRSVLRHAVNEIKGGDGTLPGLTVAAATMATLLQARATGSAADISDEVAALQATLTKMLEDADTESEPLASIAGGLGLDELEFRLMLLALAPELDPTYQRCIGLLLDDLGRRVGTLGFYSSLLGSPIRVRCKLAECGNLARWRVFDTRNGRLPAADEPLRLDPPLAEWLIGNRDALEHDPQMRRALRLTPWPGGSLLDHLPQMDFARQILRRLEKQLDPRADVPWLLFAAEDASTWLSLLERGAQLANCSPVRVQVARLVALDVADIEDISVRLGRLSKLTRRPLLLDVTTVDPSTVSDDAVRLILSTLSVGGCRGGVICTSATKLAHLLCNEPAEVVDDAGLLRCARSRSLSSAVRRLGLDIGQDCSVVAQQFPLQPEGFERALRLAQAGRSSGEGGVEVSKRFIASCQSIAAEGSSQLAVRMDPQFRLADVVLPRECAEQLAQIVDSVRLASKVLDEWQFREQLPYGHGVTALFHGPSGTGKTMSALGIAHELGCQVLRIDLSRVVSKYIGDTEKNVDRVFSDASRCGAAILIDEADALLGKRSEVRDAHDRYANIEVSFLLQRIEAHDGIAIFTTNARQNLDSAFLRRLRFIVDFPRPDAPAREEIWRRCLPAQSHELDDAAFRQLARKIDMTGGHIRQITLQAAFIAAAAGSRIHLRHIAQASRAEMAKLGMPPVTLDLGAQREAA